MIGKLISKAIKVVTLPLDLGEIILDKATGGDGSRRGLKNTGMALSDVRDKIADIAESIDEGRGGKEK